MTVRRRALALATRGVLVGSALALATNGVLQLPAEAAVTPEVPVVSAKPTGGGAVIGEEFKLVYPHSQLKISEIDLVVTSKTKSEFITETMRRHNVQSYIDFGIESASKTAITHPASYEYSEPSDIVLGTASDAVIEYKEPVSISHVSDAVFELASDTRVLINAVQYEKQFSNDFVLDSEISYSLRTHGKKLYSSRNTNALVMHSDSMMHGKQANTVAHSFDDALLVFIAHIVAEEDEGF